LGFLSPPSKVFEFFGSGYKTDVTTALEQDFSDLRGSSRSGSGKIIGKSNLGGCYYRDENRQRRGE
jgi:hypothetical protein